MLTEEFKMDEALRSERKEGREEGREEGRKDIAKTLLKSGELSIERISEVTKVPVSELQKLQEKGSW